MCWSHLFGSYCDDGVSAVIGVQKVTVTFILVTQIVQSTIRFYKIRFYNCTIRLYLNCKMTAFSEVKSRLALGSKHVPPCSPSTPENLIWKQRSEISSRTRNTSHLLLTSPCMRLQLVPWTKTTLLEAEWTTSQIQQRNTFCTK